MENVKFEICTVCQNGFETVQEKTLDELLDYDEDWLEILRTEVLVWKRQYTGLSDVNGIEAFEGDWVSPCHGNYVTGEIIKWKGAFWVSGKDKRGCSGRDLLAHYPKFTIETNIYQTPELKGEE